MLKVIYEEYQLIMDGGIKNMQPEPHVFERVVSVFLNLEFLYGIADIVESVIFSTALARDLMVG